MIRKWECTEERAAKVVSALELALEHGLTLPEANVPRNVMKAVMNKMKRRAKHSNREAQYAFLYQKLCNRTPEYDPDVFEEAQKEMDQMWEDIKDGFRHVGGGEGEDGDGRSPEEEDNLYDRAQNWDESNEDYEKSRGPRGRKQQSFRDLMEDADRPTRSRFDDADYRPEANSSKAPRVDHDTVERRASIMAIPEKNRRIQLTANEISRQLHSAGGTIEKDDTRTFIDSRYIASQSRSP